MKSVFSAVAFIFFSTVFVKAQTVNFDFINSIASQSDSAGVAKMRSLGYLSLAEGEFQLVKDNKIISRVYIVKGLPNSEQENTYWAFQVRGKKEYSPIIKAIKKGAVVTEGMRFGKPKTEYKSTDGMFYYPFEDSSINQLYWVYASKSSLLDKP